MLLGRLRIRGKLALLVTIPLLCMAGLTVPVVWERAAVAQRADEIARTVHVAGRVGTLLQHLQRERLLAVGLLLGQAERTDLVQQIAEVDDRIADLRVDLGTDLPAQVDTALDGIRTLAELRTAVLAGQAAPEQILGGYGPVHTALIDALRLRFDVDTRTSAGRQVLALDGMLRTGEGMSAGATLIVLVAAQPTEQLATAYVANMATLNTESVRFSSLITPEQLALVDLEAAAVTARTNPDFLVQSGLDPVAATAGLEVETLYPAVSSMITLGQFVEKKLVADVTAEVRADRTAALSAAYWVSALVVTVLVVVVLLAFAVGRAVARPLTRLTRSADRVARVAESELVRVADDESDTAQPVRLDPVDIRARDEIGDLARAFERVQNTAAGLVERQVASRRNVAQMFGHVGRRTQNLVGRQLALIDRLERQETDPGRLEQMYRLDHISSRLRRNAGSLVVLSGAKGDDAHVAPVPLADAVRLALGEIEDYTRVDVQVPAGVSAAPAVIGDLVLTLAELMENATVFSPPHTRVVVTGVLTEDGATLSVVDHGIGMSEERLAEENARLTRRERLDLAPTEVLGLFVVGRLARRHGWLVSLAATAAGGVTATIRIPRSCLVVGPAERTGAVVARAALPSRDRPGPSGPSRRRPDTPPRTGRALAVVGAGPARPVLDSTALPDFDPTLLSRATESMETGESWDAFGAAPATDPAAPPGPPPTPGTAPAVAEPVRAKVLQIAPAPGSRPGRMPGIRQRVPGASLPRTAPVVAPVDATGADPAAARALVEQFESGVRRAEQVRPEDGPPLPAESPVVRPEAAPRPVTVVPADGRTKLTRRVPGANLTVPPPRQPPAQHPGDPAEVRDLINAFETGVARALREVRPDRRTEEGTTR
ncbi:histidine kinase [Micromonospora rosaria]|uniref:histidine kinase n=1 Tax=Micromonospora rosaria TaxID=47874 RepID=A0A136PUX5_9ACTN|nr:nitrate- and nitrite sensing domain-containing protein [Micromonospora rosaria]KXK62258.1 histidine kinase [Micromonospora rosaria]